MIFYINIIVTNRVEKMLSQQEDLKFGGDIEASWNLIDIVCKGNIIIWYNLQLQGLLKLIMIDTSFPPANNYYHLYTVKQVMRIQRSIKH